jgi:hypothetical protein
MTPPLSLRQAITSSPRASAVAMKTPAATRIAGAHGGDSNGGGTSNQQTTKSTETATMTPRTSFVGLYLIYYYYLFIYHYIDCDVTLSRCRHRRSIHAAATILPPSRCAPPPHFALQPPPLTLPPLPRCRQAATNVAMARCCHQQRRAVALLPTPQTLPLPPLTPPCCRRHCAVALPPPPQPPRCCHRAAAVALCAAAALRAATTAAALPPSCRQRHAAAAVALCAFAALCAATTAAAPPPSCHRRHAVALPPPLQQLQWPTEAKQCDVGMGVCSWQILDRRTAIFGVRVFAQVSKKTNFHKTDTQKNSREQKKASHRLLRIRISVYRTNKNTA